MNPERLRSLMIRPGCAVRDAVKAIDAGAVEIALLVDDEDRLLGTVSDGDVRRALLAGTTLDDPIDPVVHRTPTSAPVGTDPAQLLQVMTERGHEQIPLLDGDGRIVDMAFMREVVHDTMTADTPVVLMAGGKGMRLRPLTEDRPKPMLPVGAEERPLLETTLEQIAGAGFRKVLLTVNYRAEIIEQHFGEGDALGLDISYVREQPGEQLGSAGALNLAREHLDRPFIVMNADLLTKVNLGALIRFHGEDGNMVTVGVRQYQLQVPYGVVDLDGTRVTALREKPTMGFFVNAGIYAVSPEAVQLMPQEINEFNMTDLIEAALARGGRVGSFPIREYWLDIGQLADYERAHDDHATYFSPKA
jgi:dTDP-glucose pyrophosphorylase/CBS domain-containing protein